MISGSSAFSKTSLNIWKFMVHILLKPCLENFEHYFTTGGISHSFFQGIFLTQGSNLDLLHCRQIAYPLSHQGSPAAWYVRGQNWKLLEWECDLGQDTLLCFLFICKSRNHNSTLLSSSLFIRVALMVKQCLVYSNWYVNIIKMKQRFCCLSFLLWLEHILLLFRTIWGKLTKEKNPCLYCLSPHQSKSIH